MFLSCYYASTFKTSTYFQSSVKTFSSSNQTFQLFPINFKTLIDSQEFNFLILSGLWNVFKTIQTEKCKTHKSQSSKLQVFNWKKTKTQTKKGSAQWKSMKKYLIFKIDENWKKHYSSVNNLKAPDPRQKTQMHS